MSNDWITVCKSSDLTPGSGVCALHQNEQVAIFRDSVSDKVYAVSNFDPIGEANVLSRGIVGSIGDKIVVASPLYKQHFCLDTGECLEDESQRIKTYPVRMHQGELQLQA